MPKSLDEQFETFLFYSDLNPRLDKNFAHTFDFPLVFFVVECGVTCEPLT